MKKLLCLLLVVVMLGAVLVSCKDKAETPDGGTTAVTTPVVSDDPNRVPPATQDFGGYEYKLVMDQQTEYEFQAPEEIGSDGINKALVERNKKVEGLYNISIVESRNPNGDVDGNMFLEGAAASGDYFGDIYSNYAIKMIQIHSVKGYYLDAGKLKSLRLDKEWWDQDYMDEFTVNGHIYTFTGDIQTNDDLHEIELAVNLSLYNKTYNGQKNLYEIVVKNKTWTWEEFYNTWNNFGSRDGGATGKVDSDDLVGFYYDCRTASYIYMASGMKAFTVENNKPVLSISSTKANNVIIDRVQLIVDGQSGLKTARMDDVQTGGGYDFAAQHFAAGKALMMACNLGGGVTQFSDMEDSVVYVPFPKYDAEQSRYYSLVHMCFEPMAISANVEDPERTALITEALCFYSDALENEVMRVLLKERLTADLEARECLQLVLDSKVYDFEYTANIMGWTHIVNDQLLCKNQLTDYVSQMTKLSKLAVKGSGGGSLEKFLASYGELSFRR